MCIVRGLASCRGRSSLNSLALKLGLFLTFSGAMSSLSLCRHFCCSYTQLLLRIPKILTLAFSSILSSFSVLPLTYCSLVPLSLQLLCSSLVLWDPSLLSAVCNLLSKLSPVPSVFWDWQDRKVPQARKLQAGLTSFCPEGRSQELVRFLLTTLLHL